MANDKVGVDDPYTVIRNGSTGNDSEYPQDDVQQKVAAHAALDGNGEGRKEKGDYALDQALAVARHQVLSTRRL